MQTRIFNFAAFHLFTLNFTLLQPACLEPEQLQKCLQPLPALRLRKALLVSLDPCFGAVQMRLALELVRLRFLTAKLWQAPLPCYGVTKPLRGQRPLPVPLCPMDRANLTPQSPPPSEDVGHQVCAEAYPDLITHLVSRWQLKITKVQLPTQAGSAVLLCDTSY